MKRISIYPIVALGTLAPFAVLCSLLAQADKSPSVPQLSTADRVAIQSLEKTKQEAVQTYNQAAQEEQAIEREFTASHPGYAVNDRTFAVEKIAQAADVPKPGAKP